ncbi:NAD(P)H-dependent oxidoreductase [bacterium]|nr:NAD(P)H-dependent oxidoreductase [bacterium]
MIEIISGTNRAGSNSRKVATAVESIYRDQGVSAQVLDIADLPMEIFHPDVYAKKPASLETWTNRILQSAGIAVVVPEYNGGFPGALKYFIDMLPFPQSFQNRPVCFIGIGAGEWGGLRPVEQLQQVFGYRNAFICPYRVFIKGVHHVFDETGQLKQDDLKDRLAEQARLFVDFIRRTEA